MASLGHEIEAPDGQKSAEGVRARLCQAAVEVLSSPTYLAGAARAGVMQDEAWALCEQVRACAEDLRPFFEAGEFEQVYGPVATQIFEGLDLAPSNVEATYNNPLVRSMEDQDHELV